MKNKNLIITILVLIIAGTGSFYGGMKYQQSKSPQINRQFTGQFNGQVNTRGGNITNGNRNGFRPVSGEIISSDDKSITVKMSDGSTRIVLIDDKTAINKAEKAEKTDLTTGTMVAVFGTNNSDGSVTAENIQINPDFQFNPDVNQNQNLPSP